MREILGEDEVSDDEGADKDKGSQGERGDRDASHGGSFAEEAHRDVKSEGLQAQARPFAVMHLSSLLGSQLPVFLVLHYSVDRLFPGHGRLSLTETPLTH